MSTANTAYSQMAALFKEVYGEKVVDLTPANVKLTKMLNFSKAEALGSQFVQAVELSNEHGITFAASGEDPTLEQPTGTKSEPAKVDGAQIFARARVKYEDLAKASKGGAKAFAAATATVVRRLVKSAGKALEISILHGRRGRGTIDTGGISGSGTSRDIVISEYSWAAGIWAGAKGKKLDAYAANYTGSAINTNAAIVVSAVNMETRTISVTGNGTDLSALSAGMHFFQRTGSPTTEMAGIDAIVRNTGSLFGVDAAQYELWKGHTVANVGRITMNAVLDGVRRAVELGLEEETICIVSPKAFQVLNDEVAALRVYDSSYSTKEGKNGVEEIRYHGQSGACTIIPHLYQKNGMAHIIAPSEWKRIGAMDLGFMNYSGEQAQMLWDVPDSGNKEMRCYFNGAVFSEAPAHAVVLDNLTYS